MLSTGGNGATGLPLVLGVAELSELATKVGTAAWAVPMISAPAMRCASAPRKIPWTKVRCVELGDGVLDTHLSLLVEHDASAVSVTADDDHGVAVAVLEHVLLVLLGAGEVVEGGVDGWRRGDHLDLASPSVLVDELSRVVDHGQQSTLPRLDGEVVVAGDDGGGVEAKRLTDHFVGLELGRAHQEGRVWSEPDETTTPLEARILIFRPSTVAKAPMARFCLSKRMRST